VTRVPDAENFYNVVFHTVDETIRRAADHPFARTGTITRSANMRIIAKLLTSISHALTNQLCGMRIALAM
jgi:hypothetical protein